jgi:TusA-related sulfurtransferase
MEPPRRLSTPAAAKKKPADVSMLLPAVIGGELSRCVAAMETVLQDFQGARYISRTELATLRTAIAGASRIARQAQQLSRLAGGRLRQSHERLSLQDLVAQVLKESARRLRAAGIEVEPHLRSVEIIVDPGLLVSLLETAVDWAAARGQRIQVWLEMKNWPEHALLILKVKQAISAPAELQPTDDEECLDWFLLAQLAQAMGVLVEREKVGDQTNLTIEFPRTVRQLEGLTAIEVDVGEFMHSETRPLAGHRLLVITDDERVKRELHEVCQLLGVVLDSTPTTRQAVRFCELDTPHMVVIDERLHDKHFDELRQDLLAHNVNFPFLEIAEGHNIVEVASWMGDRMSRISRDSLRAQLPSILAMELAKVS